MSKRKPILCLDFDGVIHSYTSGWKGVSNIPDHPVPGAIEFIEEACKHFTVAIVSSRSSDYKGLTAMRAWLSHKLPDKVFDQLEWPTNKPPAFVTIDDRAITFTGEWPSIKSLKEFKPWYQKDGLDKPG